MAAQSGNPTGTVDDSTFRLDDASADRFARQSAQVVVQQDARNPYALEDVGNDPFGKPILAEGGQDLSQGGQMPAVGGDGQRSKERACGQEWVNTGRAGGRTEP